MRPFKKTYGYFITLPDRFYPFSCKVGGRWVRGRRSYEQAAARAFKMYGLGRLGYKLTLYRELFHFAGSVILIMSAAMISKTFFGSETALYVLLWTAIAALSFQEFYVHPKKYGQHVRKGVIDWFTWVVPIALYFFLLGGGTM